MAISDRLGITVNLPTGATYDVLLVQTNDGYPEGKIDFAIGNTPRKITGIQKVAQVFLKSLLSRKGSDVIHPSLGTFFSDHTLNANRTLVDKELFVTLTNEISDAESQSKMVLNTTGAEIASQLDTVTVLGFDQTKESIVLYLRLVTSAGAVAQVALPFPELDMKLAGQ